MNSRDEQALGKCLKCGAVFSNTKRNRERCPVCLSSDMGEPKEWADPLWHLMKEYERTHPREPKCGR